MKTLIRIVVVIGITLSSNPLLSQNIIPKPGCKIKGNISINTEKKLYHLPGMKDYQLFLPKKENDGFARNQKRLLVAGRKHQDKLEIE